MLVKPYLKHLFQEQVGEVLSRFFQELEGSLGGQTGGPHLVVNQEGGRSGVNPGDRREGERKIVQFQQAPKEGGRLVESRAAL